MPQFGQPNSDKPERFSFEGEKGSKQELIGCVTEMRAAPMGGYKRIEIEEKKGQRRTLEIDMPIEETFDIKRKQSYKFMVEEKKFPVYAGQAKHKPEVRLFESDEKPVEVKGSFRREPKRSDGRGPGSNTRKYQD